jgi:hypothetical protein
MKMPSPYAFRGFAGLVELAAWLAAQYSGAVRAVTLEAVVVMSVIIIDAMLIFVS